MYIKTKQNKIINNYNKNLTEKLKKTDHKKINFISEIFGKICKTLEISRQSYIPSKVMAVIVLKNIINRSYSFKKNPVTKSLNSENLMLHVDTISGPLCL